MPSVIVSTKLRTIFMKTLMIADNGFISGNGSGQF